MTDPVEDGLRRSLAAHAAARQPVIDLPAVLTRSRRRRNRARTATGIAAVCAAAIAVTAVPALIDARDRRPQTLAGNPPQRSEDLRLQDRVLAALGEDAEPVIPPARFGPSTLTSEEGGPQLAGQTVTAKTAINVRLRQPQAQDWTLVLTVTTLEREPTQAAVEALARANAADAVLFAQEGLAGGGSAQVARTPQGAFGTATLPGRLLATVDIATGDRPVPTAQMARAALAVLRAVLPPDG